MPRRVTADIPTRTFDLDDLLAFDHEERVYHFRCVERSRPNDLHCECTRATHLSIFETALGRPIRVEVLDTLRRRRRTCHFRAHPA